jgi:hypothetical protein
MTTDKLREEIGLQVEINDKWTDDYVLALENKCIKLTEQLEAINYTHCCKSDSELLHKLLQYLSDEDELIGNRTHQQIIDNFKKLV